MDARLRRIASDYEQIKKDFAGHKNIVVTPIGEEPPQKYHVTYYVNGIYLLQDGRVETLGQHEVEIELHAEYPRYKPICRILTPIWHPNFRDGQICIGDIWGAGESLTDIIINIGDMIQYKSWNSSSPLSADAAAWAIENRYLFPVGNVDLYIADYASAKDSVEIDLFDEESPVPTTENVASSMVIPASTTEGEAPVNVMPVMPAPTSAEPSGNDFDITAEELAGIEFVPTAVRMQGASMAGQQAKGKGISFKTIMLKGVLWALIGSILGFLVSEFGDGIYASSNVASIMGYDEFSTYYEYQEEMEKISEKLEASYTRYCKENGLEEDSDSARNSFALQLSGNDKELMDKYQEASENASEYLYEAYKYEFDYDEDAMVYARDKVLRWHSGIWAGIIAMMIGLLLGIGEGVYYGSGVNAAKYAVIGASISLVIGTVSGYLAQWMYSARLDEDSADITKAFVRGLGWAIMGIGIGLATGLIKPTAKKLISCTIGGAIGAFGGGFAFNYVYDAVPNDMYARAAGIAIMGLLIGIGVGLMEQVAKAAWLKVIRGEFEGKEYLVFSGVTSIGNNNRNTIVLFKDKLVSPHHCDIIMQGSKYVLRDCGSPMGTVVNGIRVNQHMLRQGDAIAIGNSVLIFNTK